jgi:hypothetical protein
MNDEKKLLILMILNKIYLENEIKLMHNFGFFDISLSKKMKEEDMIN